MDRAVLMLLSSLVSSACSGPVSHPPTLGLEGTGRLPDDAGIKHPATAGDAGDAAPQEAGREASPADAAAETPAQCPSDTPASCPSPAPTYADVSPVLETYCARCHQPGQTLPELTSYAAAFAARDKVFTTLTGCTMPMPWPTDNERKLLLAWLICGAPQ
jgi:hypothetical protein